MNIVLIFSSFSPYHHARAAALRQLCQNKGHHLIIAAITAPSLSHQWTPENDLKIHVLCEKGSDGDVSLVEIACSWVRFLRVHRPDVVVIAGYWPLSIALLGLVPLTKRIPRILMTESHANTAKRTGFAALAKKALIRSFSAALVGGKLHKEFLVSLGFTPTRIRDGYDCVDNGFFATQAMTARSQTDNFRARYRLPRNYFLSIGRLVPKKNINTLISSYAIYRNRLLEKSIDLVIVGDGEVSGKIREQCAALHLPIREASSEDLSKLPEYEVKTSANPTVHFYGSRKNHELPVFLALAHAFVLPSIEEEWGLVVNEAMAGGCPVIVSERAGCAQDLLSESYLDMKQFDCSSAGLDVRKGGIIFNPTDHQGLATALEMMTSCLKLRDAMARDAQNAVQIYTPQRFADHILQLAALVTRVRS